MKMRPFLLSMFVPLLLANEVFPTAQNKTPHRASGEGFRNLILTMTYSHMGKPHTTIGDASFHC